MNSGHGQQLTENPDCASNFSLHSLPLSSPYRRQLAGIIQNEMPENGILHTGNAENVQVDLRTYFMNFKADADEDDYVQLESSGGGLGMPLDLKSGLVQPDPSEVDYQPLSEEACSRGVIPEEFVIPQGTPVVAAITSEKIRDYQNAPPASSKNNSATEVENGKTSTEPVNIIETKSFKCLPCQKSFARECYLNQHNTAIHSGEKPHRCEICGKRFGCVDTFQNHLGKHGGDKPYKCGVCPKQFNYKVDLKRHTSIHGQKPHVCKICGRGFVRKGHMNKHLSSVHKESQSEI